MIMMIYFKYKHNISTLYAMAEYATAKQNKNWNRKKEKSIFL